LAADPDAEKRVRVRSFSLFFLLVEARLPSDNTRVK